MTIINSATLEKSLHAEISDILASVTLYSQLPEKDQNSFRNYLRSSISEVVMLRTERSLPLLLAN